MSTIIHTFLSSGKRTAIHAKARIGAVALALCVVLGVLISGCPDTTPDTPTPGGGSTARYTCENGTAKTGAPSGTTDVVACQSCKSGYTLMGSAGADGTTCVSDTDSTAPTFTAHPAVKDGSIGATSVTVTLTASEVGTLYWVAYAASATAPADAAVLINDATADLKPTAVVARSATATVESTTDAVEIAVTGLTKSTSYNFYAVLQDAAKNTSDLSPKLEILTTATAKYTCVNGTAKGGTPSGTADVVACQSCASGYTLSGIADVDGTTCMKDTPTARYTCENGTAKTGTPSGSSDVVACQSCASGYTLSGIADVDGTTCMKDTPTARYTCENGTAKGGTPSGSSNVVACQSCVSGYTLSGNAGVNGTACVADTDSTAPTFTTAPAMKADAIGATSVTVTLTASEVGTLYWVAYAASAAAPADAAALIHDATRDTAPSTVVARSATATVVESSTDAVEIAVTGLNKSTSYNFYAVLQDAAKNTSDLSPTLVITTADTVKYTCVNGAPKGGAPTGSSDVEACQSCSSRFKLAAPPSGGAIGDVGTTCVATQYTCTDGTEKDGSPAGNDDVGACQSCHDGFKLNGDAGAVNTTCVATQYTCTDGTEKDGSPAGNADVGACQSCHDGFKLNGDAGAVNTTCVVDTTDTTKPTFTTPPTLKSGSVTGTGAEITLTASEPSTLFWVLYADGAITTAPSAAALIAAASGNAGVQRSGDTVTVGTTEATLTLTGLSAITSYDFYAVLQDGAANTGAVATLDITTPAIYTCTNGIPKAGTHAGTSNQEKCQSCDSGLAVTPSGSCEPDADNDGVADSIDVDDDNDGLIEIRTLDMLNNIRYNVFGTSYDDEEADSGDEGDTGSTAGAPTSATADCTVPPYLCGYELTRSLDFDTPGHYTSGVVNPDWRPTGGDPATATNSGFPTIDSLGHEDAVAIFEGNTHTISGAYARSTAERGGVAGLFAINSSGATVRGVGLLDVRLYSSGIHTDVGALVTLNEGTITASYATGEIVSTGGMSNNGGLVGENAGAIFASHADVNVTATNNSSAGGLVGNNIVDNNNNHLGTITASYATGDVTSSGGAGGLVGVSYSTAIIIASYATGNVILISRIQNNSRAGGLVGDNSSTSITASYATGDVSADASDAGGLVGNNSFSSATITASYATGDVTSDTIVGGLYAVNISGTINKSYSFGSLYPIGSATSSGHPTLSGVTSATDLTASNAGTSWNDASKNTLNAWDFGNASQPPAIRYADYDGDGTTYDCAQFPATVPGTTIPLVCGTTLVGGDAAQGR